MAIADLAQDLERHHDDSFAWAIACCKGNRQEAEEVLQTTYLKILEGRARFRGQSSFKTWLFAVVRRTAAGSWRRRATRRWLLESWGGWNTEPLPEGEPEDRLYRSEQTAWVQRGLKALSLRQRQVLELVFYHDLSVADAARILGVSVGTARVHYARGKKELSRALAEEAR